MFSCLKQLLHQESCLMQSCLEQNGPHLCSASYDIVIYKKHVYLVIQMTKIYFSCIFGLHSQFLPHSSPWNFLSDESNGSIFCYNIGSLVLSSWKLFRVIKVKWVLLFITRSFPPQLGLYSWRWLFGKHLEMGAGCQGNQAGIESWNFQSHPLVSREGREAGGWINHQ